MRFRGRKLPRHVREIIKDDAPSRESDARKLSKAKKASALEEKFGRIWKAIGGPELEREVRLIPGRLFRFDFCDRRSLVCIEIHGGCWMRGGGRHSRGSGFQLDRFKVSAAQELGYIVYELTSKDITVERLSHILSVVKSRLPEAP